MFKKPDVNKPRLRLDINKELVIDETFFNCFREKYPKSPITKLKDAKNILKDFHLEVANVISTERDGFELPMVGNLIVLSCERPNKDKASKMVDFKKSAELGVVVRHTNFETDMKICKIGFTMGALKYKIKMAGIWKFKATQSFSRIISKNYKKNYKTFIEIPKYKFISTLFK